MNWGVLVLMGWVALGLELSLRKALALGNGNMAPSFVLCLLTIVAVGAPSVFVYWIAWGAGLLLDLTFMLPTGHGEDARIIGPYTLGFVAAAYALVALRPFMYRRSPFAIGFLALVAAIVAHVVVLLVFSIRATFLDDLAWSTWREVLPRLGASFYTGLLMTLLAPLTPIFARWLRLSDSPGLLGGTAARI